MRFMSLIGAGCLGVLVSACATPVQNARQTVFQPTVTASNMHEAPSFLPGSTAEQRAAEWVYEEDVAFVHPVSGGRCPLNMDDFELNDHGHVPDGAMSAGTFSPICVYRNHELDALVTLYFYPTRGDDRRRHMIEVTQAAMYARSLELDAEETRDCDTVLQLIAGMNDALRVIQRAEAEGTAPPDQTQVHIDADGVGVCTAMRSADGEGYSYAALDVVDGYFYKIRMSVVSGGEEKQEALRGALVSFFAMQRMQGVELPEATS